MRHPLRRMALQGAWYAAGTSLVKLSGLILLPVLTNATYLPVADYGLWGVLEITVQIAVVLLGLSLPVGLVRFHHEENGGRNTLAASWWLTVLIGLATVALALPAIHWIAPSELRPLYQWLLIHVACEILLAVPLALMRAQEQAGRHTILQTLKLTLLVALALYLMAMRRMGLFGLVQALALSSAATLIAAVLSTAEPSLARPRLPGPATRRLLRFSAPLVLGALASMVLNAGDRYVLAALRPAEDLAVYSLATRFGGVVNMLAVQPMNLAWMPVLFRLQERQRPEVTRMVLPYLALGFSAVVLGVTLLAGPLLALMKSDPVYARSLPLIPWVGFGFAAYGITVVSTGVLALFDRPRTISVCILLAALLNLGLNFILVPSLGALGSAIATLASYLFLVGLHFRIIAPLLPNRYPWARVIGVAALSAAAAIGGVLKPFQGSTGDWLLRVGLVIAWAAALLLTRWFTLAELREVWTVLRRTPEDSPATPTRAD